MNATRARLILALALLLGLSWTAPLGAAPADDATPGDGTKPADATNPDEKPKPPDETRPGEATEHQLSPDQAFRQWSQNPDQPGGEQGDRLETQQVPVKKAETVKLKNVVPPIHFESGAAKIPSEYVDRLAKILESVRYRKNVRVHFVGHADSQRLSADLARQYGDNYGLSRERAGEVAEYFKKALRLPAESITYEWVGDSQPVASNDTEEGRAQNRRVETEVWYDEMKDAVEEQEVVVPGDVKRVKVCRSETVCKMRYQDGQERRARVRNLVVPLRYQDETTPISDDFTRQVRQALDNLRDRQGVKVRFIGFTDDAPLTERDERIYGDHLALSKARARRVALAMKDLLKLPSTAIESDGRGTAQPLAANETEQGRALNCRVEVEFWYDDPLQELPDEPVMCPGDAGNEMVTKVYDPPWGSIPTIGLENGQPVIPPGYAETLHRALADIADRTNARLRFIGYTKNEVLDRRTASVYGDDIGLSASRARRALELLVADPQLTGARSEHEGRGFVQSDDVVNSGFIQGETSFVRVQAVYDEPAPLLDYEGVDITRINRELSPKSPYELNTMRITVDGKPIDDPDRSSSDVQRCTDVALDSAKIRFHFDNLESRPRLGVSAHPVAVTAGDPVAFRVYSNYSSFIKSAEIRLFEKGRPRQGDPLAIIPVDAAGLAEWRPAARELADPVREFVYVLRAYDAKGRFDETEAQPLWVYREAWPEDGAPPAAASNPDAAPVATAAPTSEAAPAPETAPAPDGSQPSAAPDPAAVPPADLLASYGESDLARHQIPLEGGAVTVQGSGIPAGHTVWVAGRQVPVDPQGNFVAQEILPSGAHTVEVAVLDDAGNGSLYLRDLEFKKKDLFYVAMADVTVSGNKSSGPIDQLQGQD
ncbi:MAG TPA: OmpA family protein, partial [Dongiaceae bacterium]|nr:OmpA family protein [Dongiaceae bacterium]